MKKSLILKLLSINVIFTFLVIRVNVANILGILGYPGKSQYIMTSALLKGLAKRGHQITSISTFPQKTPINNFRDITVIENSKLFEILYTEVVKGVQ
ncbi:UDP-glucosyltransferase 2-like [Cochliomyia hominivorax]